MIGIENNDFLDLTKMIYPDTLPLEKSSGTDDYCDYLDMRLFNGRYAKIDVFDKTTQFNFEVVKFIHANSNVHRIPDITFFFHK